jgi:hypothetical protein
LEKLLILRSATFSLLVGVICAARKREMRGGILSSIACETGNFELESRLGTEIDRHFVLLNGAENERMLSVVGVMLKREYA